MSVCRFLFNSLAMFWNMYWFPLGTEWTVAIREFCGLHLIANNFNISGSLVAKDNHLVSDGTGKKVYFGMGLIMNRDLLISVMHHSFPFNTWGSPPRKLASTICVFDLPRAAKLFQVRKFNITNALKFQTLSGTYSKYDFRITNSSWWKHRQTILFVWGHVTYARYAIWSHTFSVICYGWPRIDSTDREKCSIKYRILHLLIPNCDLR